ncbi:hypothetical protein [Salmonella enterica]|uniref:hypothetical protein n=1 Tax=Salmonella enterica TaxID=28901 RepID=UPI0021B3D1D5|nr:hypothetical protein [Salmonella enterica]MCT7108671.1 hypothetical protein [Salmonella enterica subsp. enterica serovar Give]
MANRKQRRTNADRIRTQTEINRRLYRAEQLAHCLYFESISDNSILVQLCISYAALMRIASAPRPKSTAACTAQNNWRIACISSPSAITVSWYNCVYRQRSVIWQTTCRNFKNWRERRENNPPESLKQTRHSASGRWWGVALHDIQEAL